LHGSWGIADCCRKDILEAVDPVEEVGCAAEVAGTKGVVADEADEDASCTAFKLKVKH
jgi:hypothetical protein